MAHYIPVIYIEPPKEEKPQPAYKYVLINPNKGFSLKGCLFELVWFCVRLYICISILSYLHNCSGRQ